jgi:hypothetical protein
MVRSPLVFAISFAACTSFQDPDIVVDIRVIAMSATPPEQLLDIPSFVDPPPEASLLAMIQPTQVCALVSDPGQHRDLRWSMTLCNFNEDERCDDNGDPQELIGSGIEPNPDITDPEPSMCASVMPDSTYAGVIQNALSDDPLDGLRVGGVGGNPALDLYAEKLVQLAAKDPPQRTPDTNPAIEGLTIELGQPDSEDLSAPVPLPLGRCVDQVNPFIVPAGLKARITPVEIPGSRSTYYLPTLNGSSESFVLALNYQWTATAGQFDNGSTGGPPDLAGTPPPLFTDWFAPSATDINNLNTDVSMWLVQRDGRFGAHWYEMCLRVQP